MISYDILQEAQSSSDLL